MIYGRRRLTGYPRNRLHMRRVYCASVCPVCLSIRGSRFLPPIQLVIDKNIATLPRRKTDSAIIVRSQDNLDAKARVFKLNAIPSDPVLLERSVFQLSVIKTCIRSDGISILDAEVMNDNTDSIALDVHCLLGTNPLLLQSNRDRLSTYLAAL